MLNMVCGERSAKSFPVQFREKAQGTGDGEGERERERHTRREGAEMRNMSSLTRQRRPLNLKTAFAD